MERSGLFLVGSRLFAKIVIDDDVELAADWIGQVSSVNGVVNPE